MLYIFGISGKAGSGKDKTASYVQQFLPVQSFEVKTYAFADDVKQMASNHFPELLSIISNMENEADPKQGATRALYQGIGHGIRKEVGADFWIDRLFNKIIKDFEAYKSTGGNKHFVAVVKDIRYVNELMRVLTFPSAYRNYFAKYETFVKSTVIRLEGRNRGLGNFHPSENALDNFPFHSQKDNSVVVYRNTGSLEELSVFTKDWVKGSMI